MPRCCTLFTPFPCTNLVRFSPCRFRVSLEIRSGWGIEWESKNSCGFATFVIVWPQKCQFKRKSSRNRPKSRKIDLPIPPPDPRKFQSNPKSTIPSWYERNLPGVFKGCTGDSQAGGPLFQASLNGEAEAVRVLLAAGANTAAKESVS